MSEVKSKGQISDSELAEVSKLFPPETPVTKVVDWLKGIGPMPDRTQEGVSRTKALIDCITLGIDRLKEDPQGQVLWVHDENHAYFIPSGASEEMQVPGLFQQVKVESKTFKIQPWTAGQLKHMVISDEAVDLTVLLREQIGQK